MFEILFTPEKLCSFNNCSMCCGYLTQMTKTPRKKKDFDNLLWQVSHDDVHIFKNADGWYLKINNPCQHLLEDGDCGIYDNRPSICHDYGNDICEYDVPEEERFELFFHNHKSLLKYCKKRFKNWGKKKKSINSTRGDDRMAKKKEETKKKDAKKCSKKKCAKKKADKKKADKKKAAKKCAKKKAAKKKAAKKK